MLRPKSPLIGPTPLAGATIHLPCLQYIKIVTVNVVRVLIASVEKVAQSLLDREYVE